jgi:protein ImuA
LRPPRADLAALRQRVRAIETGGRAQAAVSLGDAALDAALPDGGLARAALHEAQPEAYLDGPAALGFLFALAVRTAGPAGEVIWVRGAGGFDFGAPYAPGLTSLGLDPGRVLLVETVKTQDALWAAEEAARTPGAAVLVELGAALDLVAARRLQLAAETGGGALFLLRPTKAVPAAPARTRWRLAARPSATPAWAQRLPAAMRPPGSAAWRARLARSRGGGEAMFDLEMPDAQGGFRLAAVLADRAVEPPRRRFG